MGKFTVDKKLELISQIRSRYQQDRYDMFRRERLLYGKVTPIPTENEETAVDEYDEEISFSTLPLRTLVAVGLFLLVIICDMSEKSFMGIHPSQCFSAISTDYESSITKWVDAASRQNVTDKDITDENPPAGSRP